MLGEMTATRERRTYRESYYVRTHDRNALVWLAVQLRRSFMKFKQAWR